MKKQFHLNLNGKKEEMGNEVKITGSFLNNWKEQMYMKKNLSTGFLK